MCSRRVWNAAVVFLQTFRPKKGFDRGTLKFSLHKQANASLNSGIDLKEVVKLPPGEDVNDWIAVHGKAWTPVSIVYLCEGKIGVILYRCTYNILLFFVLYADGI